MKLPFHNWQHTLDVVENAELIARNENLSEDIIEELIIASYFHDLGNVQGSTGHEKRSCEYAREFLTDQDYSDQHILNILYNIKATEMPQQPNTIAEKVICDADLAHLGKENYMRKNKALRLEWEKFNDTSFGEVEWIGMNIAFLSQHSFHTDFAKEYYRSVKLENIKKLEQELQ